MFYYTENNVINCLSTVSIWDILTAIGTCGATILAIIPTVKENWRLLWLKISEARVTPYICTCNGDKDTEPRLLSITITNNKNFDIGIQLAYVHIYLKKPFYKHSRRLSICFGTRDRHPSNDVKSLETNTYFLKYNNTCWMECTDFLCAQGIPSDNRIRKVKIQLQTTVGKFYYKIPHKKWFEILDSLRNFQFEKPNCEIHDC